MQTNPTTSPDLISTVTDVVLEEVTFDRRLTKVLRKLRLHRG